MNVELWQIVRIVFATVSATTSIKYYRKNDTQKAIYYILLAIFCVLFFK